MQVFLTGAMGVFGRRILDRLTDRGHDVAGLVRDDDGADLVRSLGGRPVRGDLLDRDSLSAAVDEAVADVAATAENDERDAVVHAATRLPPTDKPTGAYWERNDRVRREGAANLLATLGDRVDQFVFPSVAWVARQPDGAPFDETAERRPDRTTQSAADVEDRLEAAAADRGFDAAILRTGFFYGPDDHYTRSFAADLLTGDLPVVGGGPLGRRDAELSLLHVDDAARAVDAAVEERLSGLYHVVDDEPVTVADYLATFADLLDAPAPGRVPWWVARPFAGRDTVRFMTNSFPTSSEKFRRHTDWEPTYPTYREGLAQVVDTWREDGTLEELRPDDSPENGRWPWSRGSTA